ncbi:helix-turn-helix domain-containing protein [Nocardia sp. NBC_01327]|uniref:helix-turn-helix domain-containing protein n=1 Tax=Nocardia sp. NBC_01327 TaxID=2903593 RepID=UPI002E146509|nr:helix-turn-helix domain-containing protein [Nocardia sp. NBC_01327]
MPPLLVSELLDRPDLGLELLSHSPSDRIVRGVYTTDLPDPVGYLAGGELVLTSAGWYRTESDAEIFCAALAGAGSAALVVGTAIVGRVPQAIRDAAQRHRLTLCTVRDDVSYATITAAVHSAITGAPGSGLHRELLASLAAGEGPEGLVSALRRATRLDCALLSATGLIMGGALPEPEAGRLDRAFRNALAEAVFPSVQAVGQGTASLHPVQSPIARRPPVGYLVTEGDYRDREPWIVDAITQVCALWAMTEAARQERRLIEERFLRESLNFLGTGDDGAAEARLRSLGLDPDRPITAVLASTADTRYGAELAAVVLGDIVRTRPGSTEPIGTETGYLVLTPVESDTAGKELIDVVRQAAERLRPLVGGGRVVTGIGHGATGITALRRSLHEARHAHRTAMLSKDWFSAATSAELSSHLLLLASVPDDVRILFRQRLIGPLEDYDRERGADLVATLAAFLDASGSWSRCAAHLHVHVNTLRYRIGRIEQLTGHSLAGLNDRVDFHLALSIG